MRRCAVWTLERPGAATETKDVETNRHDAQTPVPLQERTGAACEPFTLVPVDGQECAAVGAVTAKADLYNDEALAIAHDQ